MHWEMVRFLWVLLLGTFSLGLVQPTGELTTEVTRALEQGSARGLSRHFGQNVDLYLPDSEGTFSRSQGEIILRDFFSKNTPASFSVDRQGPARDGSIFVIGSLKTTEGGTFRTYFLLKKVSDTFYLHHIQMEAR